MLRKSAVRICAAIALLAGSLFARSLFVVGASPSGAAPPSTPDFFTDTLANFSASQVGQTLTPLIQDLPNYAGLAIEASGVQVDVVGAPTSDIEAAAKTAQASVKSFSVPVTFVSVSNSEDELAALTNKIGDDEPDWASRGVVLTAWAPDFDSNSL